ncbi:TPM domain-containing protein [Methylocapsa sp. S129]|uniref:TPM domain-containing protein n=1 Tax=Methylocapsa sp. S129 TaxID=1641869 RepID=UPI00131B5AB0|nr:TPM domain-containing protein [Methylocapsa sp. S129]
MVLAHEEAVRIEAALRAAQARSSGQIVCVLARASAHYEIMPLIWSALIALATPLPLLFFTELSAERIFIAQLAIFLVTLAVLSLPSLRLLLTPRSVRRANAHRAALEQFVLRGATHCAERNGILIYVSLAERYARIVADDGAAKAIDQSQWRAIVDKLTNAMKTGATGDALIGAATHCGDLLARHFPPHEGRAAQVFQRFHVL